MYSNAISSRAKQIILNEQRGVPIETMDRVHPARVAQFTESANFLKWGIDIWDWFVMNPDKRDTTYKGWKYKAIHDNIEQLHDNLRKWIKIYPGLPVSPALSRNLDKAYEIFTRKHTWTVETDPKDSDLAPTLAPTLDLEDEEMTAGIAGLSPKVMMIAGGAVAAVLVLVLIFKKK